MTSSEPPPPISEPSAPATTSDTPAKRVRPVRLELGETLREVEEEAGGRYRFVAPRRPTKR